MIAPPVPLPPEVAVIVARRHDDLAARLARQGSGRVLDLSDLGAVDLVLDAGRTPAATSDYDVIISAVALPRFADAALAVQGMYRLLNPGGVLWLIEPVAHVGASARLRATVWAASRSTRGHHLEREIPFTARSTGFTITDLERFTMPTRIWPLRRFIEARARRYPPIGDLPGDMTVALAEAAR